MSGSLSADKPASILKHLLFNNRNQHGAATTELQADVPLPQVEEDSYMRRSTDHTRSVIDKGNDDTYCENGQ